MEKVRVFTETFFHGSFGNGRGEYYILLECTRSEVPITKEKYAMYENKTKNEIELIALIEVLKSFVRKCEIELHMKKSFISETIKAGRLVKWQQDNWKNKKGEILATREKNADGGFKNRVEKDTYDEWLRGR